jgi:steroid 5-alpha reductase family enzyme
MLAITAVTSSLLLTFIIDFGIQFLFYIYSALSKTEKLYDLSGSLTYQACALVALLVRADPDTIQTLSARQIIAAAGVLIWSLRLGIFLFIRVLRTEDKRFDQLKVNPLKFAVPWFLQVIWIYLTALPVWIILGNPGINSRSDLFWADILGIIIWTFGFTVEVIADTQKFIFKNKHPNDFISTGIWRYSRYANYFGEIVLWIGMFVLCTGGFVESWQWIAIISPLFVAFLITQVSGIPLLEKSSESRYGSRPDYQSYKAQTSKFFLWPPKRMPAEPLS